MYKTYEQMLVKGTGEWKDNWEEIFPIVEASRLTLGDHFMQHEPQNEAQRELKKYLSGEISSKKFYDFRMAVMDPSLDREGNIVFEKGWLPATGMGAPIWDQKAKAIMPEKNSRLSNKREHRAFLGVILKTLVDQYGMTPEHAWLAVCDDSHYIAHYKDSVEAKETFELTARRCVGKWFDLANTKKIIKLGAFFYATVSGCYKNLGKEAPLACYRDIERAEDCEDAVGLIVMDV